MKKFTYVMPYPESLTGISAKFNSQLEVFKQSFDIAVIHLVPDTSNSWLRALGRFPKELILLILLLFRSGSIYYRYCPLCVVFNIFLPIAACCKNTWVELNTCYLEELKTENWIHLFLHRLSMASLKLGGIMFLPVTGEIGELEKLPEGRFVVLPNGINHSTPKPLGYETSEITREIDALRKKGEKVLVFSASRVEPWHGLDQIVELCAKMDNVCLVIFGVVLEPVDSLTSLEKEGRAKQFGKIAPDELEVIYEFCDFGLASFGFDRIGLTEACPLKTRGYLKAGIRVIGNYFDSVLHDEWAKPYFYQFDGDVEKLKLFIESQYDREELKRKAVKHLSWDAIFKKAKVIEN